MGTVAVTLSRSSGFTSSVWTMNEDGVKHAVVEGIRSVL